MAGQKIQTLPLVLFASSFGKKALRKYRAPILSSVSYLEECRFGTFFSVRIQKKYAIPLEEALERFFSLGQEDFININIGDQIISDLRHRKKVFSFIGKYVLYM